MEQEDKQLLLVDLCARLPYGVKAQVIGWDEEKGEIEVPLRVYSINTDGYVYFEINDYDVDYLTVDACPLYLRPMSSMTEEEIIEYKHFVAFSGNPIGSADFIDWLNAHHFDYRGLIEKGLALEAPKGMYGKEDEK